MQELPLESEQPNSTTPRFSQKKTLRQAEDPHVTRLTAVHEAHSAQDLEEGDLVDLGREVVGNPNHLRVGGSKHRQREPLWMQAHALGGGESSVGMRNSSSRQQRQRKLAEAATTGSGSGARTHLTHVLLHLLHHKEDRSVLHHVGRQQHVPDADDVLCGVSSSRSRWQSGGAVCHSSPPPPLHPLPTSPPPRHLLPIPSWQPQLPLSIHTPPLPSPNPFPP